MQMKALFGKLAGRQGPRGELCPRAGRTLSRSDPDTACHGPLLNSSRPSDMEYPLKDSLSQLRLGMSRNGDSGKPALPPPAWLDRDKFYRAKQVFHKYFFSIYFCHLAGLLMLLHVPSILSPLMKTGKSSNVACLFRRYLGTLMHVRRWYEGDVWDPSDPAHESILWVRKTHKKVADRLNAGIRPEDNRVLMSQYDMALTQFAFIGLIVLFHRKIGILCSQEELECLVHFWGGVGYLLGMDDDSNLCCGSLANTERLCNGVLKEVMLPSFSKSSHESTMMGQDIIRALNSFMYVISWGSLVCFWSDILEVPHKVSMGLPEVIGYWNMRLTFGVLLKLPFFRMIYNLLLITALEYAVGYRTYYEKRLRECPFTL